MQHQTARREAKRAWKKAQKEYYSKLASNINSNENFNGAKKQWKILKSVYGSEKSSSVPSLVENDICFFTDSSKAECLNDLFLSQSRINPANEPCLPSNSDYKTDLRFSDIVVTEQTIHNIMTNLNTDKATGPDGISNMILKHCAQSLCVPLNIVANKSFASSTFPTRWKSANIVPVYKKKGDKQSPSSYRPVSLLCTMSKVIERVVYNQLYDYCVSNKLLSEKNSGFKKGDGAVNQLLQIIDNIYSSFNEENETAVAS